MEATHVPTWLQGYLDDAATFPPASVPLAEAVAGFRAFQHSGAGPLVSSLVVTDLRLPDLLDVLDSEDQTGVEESAEIALPVTVLVTGGAGAIGPAVRWASRAPQVELRTLEALLRDEDDLARNAQRFVTALRACEDGLEDVDVFLELPRPGGTPTRGWWGALDEIAAAEYGTKFRLESSEAGGATAAADLASWFDAALDREVPYRCAGVRAPTSTSTDPATGARRLGLVNLLAGTRACLDGADAPAALEETSVAALLAHFGADDLIRARRWLRGVSTSAPLEIHDDLVEAGLVPAG